MVNFQEHEMIFDFLSFCLAIIIMILVKLQPALPGVVKI
jgi:hypothetical protein